jgi:hypothetical protein
MLRVRVEVWEDLVTEQHFIGYGTHAKCLRCGFCVSAFGRGPEARSKCIERLQRNCPRREENSYFMRTGWTFVRSPPDDG